MLRLLMLLAVFYYFVSFDDLVRFSEHLVTSGYSMYVVPVFE